MQWEDSPKIVELLPKVTLKVIELLDILVIWAENLSSSTSFP